MALLHDVEALIFGLACLPALYALLGLVSQIHTSKPKPKVYYDADGESTKENMATCTAQAPKTTLLVCSGIGLLISVFLAILNRKHALSSFDKAARWLLAGQWGLLFVQNLSIIAAQGSVRRYQMALSSAMSSVLLLANLFYHEFVCRTEIPGTEISPMAFTSLTVISGVAALYALWSSLNFPRRPAVLFNSILVDGQYTVSALNRYTYSWANPLFEVARQNNRLEFEDFSTMDHSTRTKSLVQKQGSPTVVRNFGSKIIYDYRWSFLSQLFWTVLQSLVSFAPQYVNLKFLRVLEGRFSGGSTDMRIWIWIILFALVLSMSSWVEQWTFWVSWSKLGVPIRAQISALVFRKAMRCTTSSGISHEMVEDKVRPGPLGREAKLEEPTTRATINLIGVDAKRISDFCAMNNLLSGSILKFIVATSFLWMILGAKPVLSGYIVLPIVLPINYILGKRYHQANHKLMKLRDAKLAVVTEAIHGIRQIKFAAQERNWHKKIGILRQQELNQLWRLYQYNACMLFCYISTPIAITVTSLSVYSYCNSELDAATAFTALAVFKNLEMALSIVPDAISRMLQARESARRVETYLNVTEITHTTKDADHIRFDDASIAWNAEGQDCDTDNRFILRDISLAFPKGELSVISGKTGSGKSLLLAAILGEVDLLCGTIEVPQRTFSECRPGDSIHSGNWIVPSSLAFVDQVPWIENTSIRQNIIFGLPFDLNRYWQVIDACALRKDLDMLADGEWTEIGAKGINLSGGQKWRITFARALYSRADTLILDDIFSAVDAHVGRHIFEQALTGDLGAGRTRILVTHHLELCKSGAKYLVELGNGTVEHAGSRSELEASKYFDEIIASEQKQITNLEQTSIVGNSNSSYNEARRAVREPSQVEAKKFVEEELRETGHVKMSYYLAYMKSSGGLLFWAPALLIFTTQEAINIGQRWWLKEWTHQQHKSFSGDVLPAFSTEYVLPLHANLLQTFELLQSAASNHDLKYYLGVYVVISALLAFAGTLQFYYIYSGSVRASRSLFNDLSRTVLRAPLRWLDTVPTGRILTRFTSDFETVDSSLAWNASQFGVACCSLLGVVIAAVFVSPWVIVLAVIIVVISLYFSLYYLPGAREIKRLESKMKSPIIESFEASLLGLTTIRAFAKVPDYISRIETQIDRQTTCSWYICLTNRWIGIRTALVGNIFTIVVAILVVIFPVDLSLAAFALNFASQYGSNVSMLVRQYTNMELDMNSTERIMEYTNIPVETSDGVDPPAAWPSSGRLEFENLVVAYAPTLPPVLKGLSISVEHKERIGVVGRTGAGKSSLTLALFRFLNAQEGTIYIDGIDISIIKLQALRSRIAIIPQDPVLFGGTIRDNLDPFKQHTDLELRDALERVNLVTAADFVVSPPRASETSLLKSHVDEMLNPSEAGESSNQNIFSSLSSKITTGGINLSQGQRQLLCLARAIVSRPKIMVLDEATSAVDMTTDALIQRSIREDFGDSTLLVIAHRLSTIADFDKILVLDEGRAVEFGAPKELIQVTDGVFRSMVESSGDCEKIKKTILFNG